jgi:RNase P/RNase MRP subunit POP5
MSKRYLLIKVVSERPVSREQFGNALIDSVRRNFGEIGLFRIDPKLVSYDGDQTRAIVSCKKDGAVELQASMALISQVSGTPFVPLVLRVSGTIKSLRRRKSR